MFGALRLSGLELAESDSLAIIGTSTASVDKGRVETVHIEVLIVDEEAFAYCGVAVIESVNVEPNREAAEGE